MELLKRIPNIKLPYEKEKQVKIIVNELMLTDQQVLEVMQLLNKEIELGLSKDPIKLKQTSLQMENTYVRTLLNGTEEGDYLALDLGGTNFRVLLCQMKNGKCESISRNYNVPTDKLHGPVEAVFDHLADSINMFLKEENMLDRKLPLGFTFSFPMIQEGIKKGILVTWTKSFACPNGVGEDAVRSLEDALSRRTSLNIDVVAVLNDTTGTLLAGSYLDQNCEIGLILGTGCNAAYVEDIKNIEKWEKVKNDPFDQVVIDTEWGAFGDNGSLNFVKTEFDRAIDRHSNHVGSFTYEKLFAGHYIGDLARLVLVKLTTEGLTFQGQVSDKLLQWKSFTAEHLSDIEKDTDESTTNTWKLLKDLELTEAATSEDVAIIRYLCSALSIRAGQFNAATLGVLLRRMKRPQITIAVDGSLYRYHPNLHNIITSWLAHLVPETKATLIDAIDGSGRGAAFVAAVAVRMEKTLHQ